MPEHLRALVVLLVLATGVFIFARNPACVTAMRPEDFRRRRNLWFAMTLTAFLAHDFWIYIVVAATVLIFTVPREPNKFALFFFLLFAVPAIPAQIPGLGIVEHLFSIDYLRLLSLTVLLPTFLRLRNQPDVTPFGRLLPDKLLLAYLALNFFLPLSGATFTNTLRHGVFYAFIDIFLPYYVASRSLKKLEDFRDALMAFVLAAFLLAIAGVFEHLRHWQLYSAVNDALGARWYEIYLLRGDGGGLRAQGSTGQPIPFGYVMAVAIGFFLYLKKAVHSSAAWYAGLCLLLVGLVVSLSRGPWVGAAAMFLLFVATGPAPLLNLSKLGLLGIVALPPLLISPAGDKIINLMPFVGTVDALTVTYRQRLFEVSIEVIKQNLFFGNFNYMSLPAMQQLIQGQGIIDMVNTYVGIALASGIVGLALFSGFFIAIAAGIARCMHRLADLKDERHILGRALLSVLLGILIIIATASSAYIVPIIYWSVAGLGVGYARTMRSVTTGANNATPHTQIT